MTEPEVDQAALLRSADSAFERLDDAWARAPGDVKAGDRVAMAGCCVSAAFGPANDGEDAVAHLVQPGALLPAGEVDVRLGPLARPVVFLAVEARGAQPILPSELVAVLDAQSALLGRVDEEQPAEAPERLTAERLLTFLVEQQDPTSRFGELGGCDQSGDPGSDDDDIRVHVGQSLLTGEVVVPAGSR